MNSAMFHQRMGSRHFIHMIRSHLCTSSTMPVLKNSAVPHIFANPLIGMADEKVNIRLLGLTPGQQVTLVADIVENNSRFQSRCVYRADIHGEIDSYSSSSLASTFQGVHDMGIFWSMQSAPGEIPSLRLVKKDVTVPMVVDINVYDGRIEEWRDIDKRPLVQTQIQRQYLKPGVRRIPLTNGRFKGTIFIPEGHGPFPSLLDMYGGLVALIETRAALLASHGYATFALSYLYGDGLPQTLLGADINYIKDAMEWFATEDYVDDTRFGVVGLCYGGFIALLLGSLSPMVKAVVNINGISLMPETYKIDKSFLSNSDERATGPWPSPELVCNTEEGIVINSVYECENPRFIPVWQHGAKVLVIVGEDDKQCHPKYHTQFCQQWPQELQGNLLIYRYPGAGHLIEPPNSPHVRVVSPGRRRLSSIDFMPMKYISEPIMTGGFTEPHAYAQEDSWHKLLKFLEETLKK